MYGDNPIFLHLDLSTFKTESCTISTPHEIKRCFYSHFPSETRRSLNAVFYSKILCSQKNSCNNSQCKYAHNYIEQIYHVDNYKRKYCKDFIESGRCKYAEFCALAHSDYELKINPLHLLPISKDFLLFFFKTEFCPFSKINHDRFTCVYAHNWQDYKRPFFNNLKPSPCKKWDKDKEILEYTEGCPLGFNCDHCHGWKECEYHIVNFKKFFCKKGSKCERKEVCSFKHDDKDVSEEKIESNFFYPVPNNLAATNKLTVDYMRAIGIELKTKLKTNSMFSSLKETSHCGLEEDPGELSERLNRRLVVQSSNNIKGGLANTDLLSLKQVQTPQSDHHIVFSKEKSDRQFSLNAPNLMSNSNKQSLTQNKNKQAKFVHDKSPRVPSVHSNDRKNVDKPNEEEDSNEELNFPPKPLNNGYDFDMEEADEIDAKSDSDHF